MRIGWICNRKFWSDSPADRAAGPTPTRGYRMEADPTTRALIMALNVLMVLALVGLIVGYIVAKA